MVPSELEAEMICGLLRSGVIQCGHNGLRSVDEMPGPYEIRVASDDLDAARAMLATVET
jgi:peptidyl-tRNA hydrolase